MTSLMTWGMLVLVNMTNNACDTISIACNLSLYDCIKKSCISHVMYCVVFVVIYTLIAALSSVH